MALTKRSVVQFLQENGYEEGEIDTVLVEQLVFNHNVMRDAIKVYEGKKFGIDSSYIDEEGEKQSVKENVSGLLVFTNNGKTLSANPVLTKCYQQALKNFIQIAHTIGLTKKAALELNGGKIEGDTGALD